MFKKSIITFVLLNMLSAYAYAEQRYMPYPIVFVSGIQTNDKKDVNVEHSPSYLWPRTLIFKELKKYFSDSTGYVHKYDDEGGTNPGEVSHLEFFFYDARQNTLETNVVERKT